MNAYTHKRHAIVFEFPFFVKGKEFMRVIAYYYDERTDQFRETNLWELKDLESSDTGEFLYRQPRLFRYQSCTVPMTLVRRGDNQGFRRRVNSGHNHNVNFRGERESLTHEGNKFAFSSMRELRIRFNGEEVRLFIRSIEQEKTIICNGSEYRIDLFFELDRTEPAHYYDELNGELWFEVYHTCKVDSKQAEDFAIERKSLFEYKVAPACYISNNVASFDEYRQHIEKIKKRHIEQGIDGYLICTARRESLANWHLSANGNWTAKLGDNNFTIIKSKYGEGYGIIFSQRRKPLWKYMEKEFSSIDEAKRVADFLAFKIYNGERL